MNKRISAKERGLIKGALRRVFSRSDTRRNFVNSKLVKHSDPTRKRVTKWAICDICGKHEAAYAMDVDHRDPVVPINKALENMSWDELIDRLWCDEKSLDLVCHTCHLYKTKQENAERRRLKKEKKK